MPPDKGKGKARAEPTERDPLLPSTSSHISQTHSHTSADHVPDSRARSIIWTGLIVLASLLLAAVLFFILLAWSFKPSERELKVLPKTAFAYSGPDAVQVLNVSEDGILVNVTVHCGIDADAVLGVGSPEIEHKTALDWDDAVARGSGADWWESLRRWTAHRALDQLSTKAIEVNITDPVIIFPRHFETAPLLSLRIVSPLMVPLITDVQPMTPWLRKVTFTALAKPIASTGEIWQFVQRAWVDGEAKVVIDVSKVIAQLPRGPWWAKFGKGEAQDLVLDASFTVPQLPGLPSPGKQLNLSELVSLDSYSLQTSPSKALTINARASLLNPVQGLNTSIPFNFPFAISLTDGNLMARVITAPVEIGSAKTIDLAMSGEIVANLSDNQSLSSSPLSVFLQNYLHGLDNPIVVRGLPSVPDFAQGAKRPPAWLLSTLPSLSLALTFPGPDPPPHIIQSVTIEHMRMAQQGRKMVVSGTVIAEIELPEGMQQVSIDVKDVLPDVLIYDGPADDDELDGYGDGEGDENPEDPDPADPPPRAFGRIKPEDFVKATTEPADDPEHPYRLVVRAPMTDVPLEVLPGRDNVLSAFVRKVVFKGGALAGIKGVASVHVELAGVSGRVLLDNLPVEGEFWVGRR